MIDSLASVKYAVLDKTETPPRGFEKIGENENYNIYRNNYSMPLGVVIDRYPLKILKSYLSVKKTLHY